MGTGPDAGKTTQTAAAAEAVASRIARAIGAARLVEAAQVTATLAAATRAQQEWETSERRTDLVGEHYYCPWLRKGLLATQVVPVAVAWIETSTTLWMLAHPLLGLMGSEVEAAQQSAKVVMQLCCHHWVLQLHYVAGTSLSMGDVHCPLVHRRNQVGR